MATGWRPTRTTELNNEKSSTRKVITFCGKHYVLLQSALWTRLDRAQLVEWIRRVFLRPFEFSIDVIVHHSQIDDLFWSDGFSVVICIAQNTRWHVVTRRRWRADFYSNIFFSVSLLFFQFLISHSSLLSSKFGAVRLQTYRAFCFYFINLLLTTNNSYWQRWSNVRCSEDV